MTEPLKPVPGNIPDGGRTKPFLFPAQDATGASRVPDFPPVDSSEMVRDVLTGRVPTNVRRPAASLPPSPDEGGSDASAPRRAAADSPANDPGQPDEGGERRRNVFAGGDSTPNRATDGDAHPPKSATGGVSDTPPTDHVTPGAAAVRADEPQAAADGPIDWDPPYPPTGLDEVPDPDEDPRGYNLWLMKFSATELKFRIERSIGQEVAGEEVQRQLTAIDNVVAGIEIPEVSDADMRTAILDNLEMFSLVESADLTVAEIEQLDPGLYRMDGRPSIDLLIQLPDFREADGEVGFLQINDQWFMQVSLPQFQGDDDVDFDPLIAVPFLSGDERVVQRDIHSHPGGEYLFPSLHDILATRSSIDGKAHVATRLGLSEISFPTELPGGNPLADSDGLAEAWDFWVTEAGQVEEELSITEFNILHRQFLEEVCDLRVIPWSNREEIEQILSDEKR